MPEPTKNGTLEPPFTTPAPTAAPPATTPDQNASSSAPPNANATHNAEGPANNETKRPRDAHMIHLLLASQGVSSYQERVPLMMLDFAYRYTSSVLQDALLFSDSINNTANTGGQNPPASIGTNDLKMSIASRVNHQFSTGLPKEFLLDIAQERNRVALPTVGPEFGVRIPPEKYCLTGVNWDLSEGMEEWADISDGDGDMQLPGMAGGLMSSSQTGGGLDGDDKMDVEDIFGGPGGDADMADA